MALTQDRILKLASAFSMTLLLQGDVLDLFVGVPFNFFSASVVVPKAKRQVQMSFVPKAKRQVQMSPTSIDREIHLSLRSIKKVASNLLRQLFLIRQIFN